MTRQMDILFLGTGAADWDWSLPLKAGVRGSTCTILDGHIMLDAGPTVPYRMEQENINPANITDIVITHSHSDHFNVGSIAYIANAPGRKEKLRLFGSKEIFEGTADLPIEGKCLEYGVNVQIAEYKFMPLPANHDLGSFEKKAYHYLIEKPNGELLLYALDGGWLAGRIREVLKGRHLDLIVWDATSGTSRYNWRFGCHNDLYMIEYMCKCFGQLDIITESTRHVFDHVARTLWPETPEERQAAAKEAGGLLAEDGMGIKF